MRTPRTPPAFHRRLVLLLAGLSAGLAAGCAAIPDCPARGGPDWRELRSEHFILNTDMRAGKAEDALRELEHLRAAVLAAAFPTARRQPTGRIPVIIVDDRIHWMEYFPRNDGVFTHALWQPLIIMYGGNSLEREETIKHELVHYLSRFYLRHQPRWLAEGLATFFESLDYDVEAREVSFGHPSGDHLRRVRSGMTIPLPALVTRDAFSGWSSGAYATSWLLVHYLANHKPREFLAYQFHLQQTDDEDKAWKQAFGADAFPALTRELAGYLSGGKYVVLTNHFQPPPVSSVARVHSDADAHVLRALLHYVGSNNQAHEAPGMGKALQNVEAALRQEPLNVTALAVRHFLVSVPVKEEVARAALLKAPDDWRAWALLWGALQGTPAAPEGKAALDRAKQLAASNPAVDFDVNWRRYH